MPSNMKDYKETVASARTAIPVAVEMEELFGDADHFITEFGFDSKPKTWNTEVFFGGRYELTMQVQVRVDYKANTVEQIGEPRFWLRGVRKIEVAPDGRVGASLDSAYYSTFAIAEWEKLRAAAGDVSVLGVKRNTIPAEHFDEYVAAARRPRVHVSLLNSDRDSSRR